MGGGAIGAVGNVDGGVCGAGALLGTSWGTGMAWVRTAGPGGRGAGTGLGTSGMGMEQGQDNGNGFLWGQGCADILGMLGTACPWGWGHAGDSGEGVSVGLGTSWGQREWR